MADLTMGQLVESLPKGWRVFMDRLPVDCGPCWQVRTRPHAEDGFQSDYFEKLEDALADVLKRVEIGRKNWYPRGVPPAFGGQSIKATNGDY